MRKKFAKNLQRYARNTQAVAGEIAKKCVENTQNTQKRRRTCNISENAQINIKREKCAGMHKKHVKYIENDTFTQKTMTCAQEFARKAQKMQMNYSEMRKTRRNTQTIWAKIRKKTKMHGYTQKCAKEYAEIRKKYARICRNKNKYTK